MKIALLRVGADSGNLGIHSPLFEDDSFEFIPINEDYNVNPKNGNKQINEIRTFGNTKIKTSKYLIDYFKESKKEKFRNANIHFDPEFKTFTYGDPSFTKKGLSRLEKGDYLIFYSSLSRSNSEAKLYTIGYFEIDKVKIVIDLKEYKELQKDFGKNFHVMHENIFERDVLCKKNKGLKLVKGTQKSKLLNKAYLISDKKPYGSDELPRFVVSKEMQKIFGDFDGKICIQRNALRFIIGEKFIEKTYSWLKKLE